MRCCFLLGEGSFIRVGQRNDHYSMPTSSSSTISIRTSVTFEMTSADSATMYVFSMMASPRTGAVNNYCGTFLVVGGVDILTRQDCGSHAAVVCFCSRRTEGDASSSNMHAVDGSFPLRQLQ